MIGSNDTHAPAVISTVKEVLTALGEDLSKISQGGWNYNAKTGFLRFERFQTDAEGKKMIDPLKGVAVTRTITKKVPPFWRKRLEFRWKAAYDDSTL